MSNKKYVVRLDKIYNSIGRVIQQTFSSKPQPQMPCGKVNSPECKAYQSFQRIFEHTNGLSQDFSSEFYQPDADIVAIAFQNQPELNMGELSRRGIAKTLDETWGIKTVSDSEDVRQDELVLILSKKN